MKTNSVGKNERRTPAKKSGRRIQIMESDSDWITGNYYINIGLTNSQVRAITRLGKRWNIRKSPCAAMARYLISLSLLNLEDTQAKLESLVRYIEAEGFNSLGSYCDRVMRAQEHPAGHRRAA